MPEPGTQSTIQRFIRGAAVSRAAAELPDAELLARFVAERDEAAFLAVLRRHGGTVLDVCRCVLGNDADAEDAFQATFLVLARQAASVRKAGSLGSWLHGVAYRVARKAQTQAARRRKHEPKAPAREPAAPPDPSWREVQMILHEELLALSEVYRAPLVLCYLQGRTQDQAAEALGLSKAAAKKRLERGRELLRKRLVRRGLGPAAVLALITSPAAGLSVPPTLASAAAGVAVRSAAGPVAGTAPPHVLTLAEGVLQPMFLTKIKASVAALGALAVAAVLAGGLGRPAGHAEEKAPPPKPAERDRPDTGTSDTPTPPAPRDGKFDGEWKVAEFEERGAAADKDLLKDVRLVFKGDTVEFKGFDGVGKCTVKVDPSKTPKEIDLTCLDGPDKGKTIRGIYIFQKSWRLKLAIRQVDWADSGRPKGYHTGAGAGLLSLTLVRPDAPENGVGGIRPQAAPKGEAK